MQSDLYKTFLDEFFLIFIKDKNMCCLRLNVDVNNRKCIFV